MSGKFNILFSSLLAALLFSAASCADAGIPVIDSNQEAGVSSVGNTMVIYEANPKVFASSGAFNAMNARLYDIQDLGANVLWIMPLHPIGVKNAVGSPYCVKDYKAVNPAYGTMDDFKALVQKAHSIDMKVIIDWVANHTSWDNVWIDEHPDWYTKNAAGNIISPEGMGWNDVADLNYDNKQMCSAMIAAMKFWVEEVGVDGFRCDYAEGVPADFWKEAIGAVRGIKKDAVMLAEAADVSLYRCGFDMLYGWNFQSKLADLYSGKIQVSQLYNCHTEEYSGLEAGKERMRFSTNHDKAMTDGSPLSMYKGEKGAMSAFVIAVYMGGVPMIYSSQEIGYPSKLNFFETNVLDWNSNPSYTQEYQKVMSAYHQAASNRGCKPVLYNTGNVVSIYYENGLFVIVNTTGKSVQFKAPIERVGDNVVDMMTGKVETIKSAISLESYEYKIFKTEK